MEKLDEMETDQLLREPIDIVTVPLFPKANRHDHDQDSGAFHSIEDAIALADRAQASESNQIPFEGLALLLGLVGQAVNAVPDLLQDSPIRNRLK